MANILNTKDIMNRKLAPIVKEGKYENVVIAKYESYDATATSKDFIRFTFKLEDGREIADNRFAQGLNIMISHLREQLDLQDVEVEPAELLKPGAHKFTIWVEKTTVISNLTGFEQRVTNIHFLEPLKKAKVSEEISEIKNDELPQ